MTIDTTDLIKALKERKRQLSKWADKDRAKERIDEIDCILDTDVPHLVKEESEKSVPADLEEPVGRKLRNNSALTSQVVIAIPIINLEKAALNFGEEIGIPVSDNFMQIARHFYDLGCTRAAEKYNEVEYNRQRAEESVPNDLEEAAWDCVLDSVDVNNPVLLPKYKELLTYLFIAGAKWQAEKDARDMYMSDYRQYEKVYQLGKKDMKEQMMKEAVEGEIQMRYSGCLCAKTIRAINEDKFKLGDKVRIIIVKED